MQYYSVLQGNQTFKVTLCLKPGGHTFEIWLNLLCLRCVWALTLVAILMQVTTYWADVMSRNFELMSCPVNNNNTVKWAMISCRLPIFKVTVMSCGRYRLLMFRPKF
jgi:hypothetical protein